jgi:hypothetical protein
MVVYGVHVAGISRSTWLTKEIALLWSTKCAVKPSRVAVESGQVNIFQRLIWLTEGCDTTREQKFGDLSNKSVDCNTRRKFVF